MDLALLLKRGQKLKSEIFMVPQMYCLKPLLSEVRALQTLIIGVNNLEAAIVNEEPIPLENALNNLREIGVDSGFLVPVLDSIPSDARVNGVLSDKALRRTFGALKPAGNFTILKCVFMYIIIINCNL